MMTDEYSLQDLLEQFKGAMEMSSTPVSEIQIITENNAISIDEYKSIAWLIDNHGWADLRVSNALTLTPNSVDKNFTILLYSSILIALFSVMICISETGVLLIKLKAESQKTKPQLANHYYQVIIQTESDDNAKDSSFKLALKHPAQTTTLWGWVSARCLASISSVTWESAWLIDNHGWADLRVSKNLMTTPKTALLNSP
jgi:hypothetical protein